MSSPIVCEAQTNKPGKKSRRSRRGGQVKGRKTKNNKSRRAKRKRKSKGKRSKRENNTYPFRVNGRPLVLPKGMGEATGTFDLTSLSAGQYRVNNVSIGVRFSYGLAKGLELGGATGFNMAPHASWSSTFNLRGGYRVLHKKKPSIYAAAHFDIPLTFGENSDLISSTSMGVTTRYQLNKYFALYSGEGLVELRFGEEVTARINIPIGIAYQVNRKLNIRLDTRMMSFGSGGIISVNQSMPLMLRGVYAIRRMMDVGLAFKTDIIGEGPFSLIGVFSYRIR